MPASNSELTAECILFGYPGKDDIVTVIHYVVITKYYIYIKNVIHDNNIFFVLLFYAC